MIKRLLLTICITTANQAEMRPFEHDELLTKMYLQVDMSDCPRIVMQEIGLRYVEYIDEMRTEAVTKEDSMYLARLSYIFGEVFISFHYGN